MGATFFAVLFVIIGGIAIALQARILGNVELKIGVLGNMFVNFFFGSIAVFLLIPLISWYRYRNPLTVFTNFNIMERLNIIDLTPGVFGIVIVTSLGYGASRIGIANTLLLGFFSQILIGSVMDHYGFLSQQVYPMTLTKIFSLCIILLGVYLFFKN